MGAWGAKPFENDEALDWLAEFNDRPALGFLEDTLRSALQAEESDRESEAKAIAAAEVVIGLWGFPKEGVTPDLKRPDWSRSDLASLKVLAISVLARIKKQSELRSLWEESDSGPWLSELDDLIRRLSQ